MVATTEETKDEPLSKAKANVPSDIDQPNASASTATSSPGHAAAHKLTKHSGHKHFNPTRLVMTDQDGNEMEWQSRRARKGRYQPVTVHVTHYDGVLHHVEMRLRRLDSEIKPHLIGDISFWVAFMFFTGSIVWVANGFMAWLPDVRPLPHEDRIELGAASIGLVGAVLFEFGAYFMVVEALDRGRETNMGTSIHRLFRKLKEHPKATVGNPDYEHDPEKTGSRDQWPSEKKGFIWWGPPLWRDMGYVAAFIMFLSATIFGVSTITGIPGVIPGMADGRHVALAAVFFSTPQVVGSVGFVASSFILMIEVQDRWWKIRPLDIGWQIAFWNVIGSFGFLLCGCFSYSGASNIQYESALSTFWGSWAFLIGAGFQLWEVSWREPPPKSSTKPAQASS